MVGPAWLALFGPDRVRFSPPRSEVPVPLEVLPLPPLTEAACPAARNEQSVAAGLGPGPAPFEQPPSTEPKVPVAALLVPPLTDP